MFTGQAVISASFTHAFSQHRPLTYIRKTWGACFGLDSWASPLRSRRAGCQGVGAGAPQFALRPPGFSAGGPHTEPVDCALWKGYLVSGSHGPKWWNVTWAPDHIGWKMWCAISSSMIPFVSHRWETRWPRDRQGRLGSHGNPSLLRWQSSGLNSVHDPGGAPGRGS